MVTQQKEDLKKIIERDGLICDCGGEVYRAGLGPIEKQPNYNRFFEYLQCPKCLKEFDL